MRIRNKKKAGILSVVIMFVSLFFFFFLLILWEGHSLRVNINSKNRRSVFQLRQTVRRQELSGMYFSWKSSLPVSLSIIHCHRYILSSLPQHLPQHFPQYLPLTWCSKVLMTSTAWWRMFNLVWAFSAFKWIIHIRPSSLKASLMSRTRILSLENKQEEKKTRKIPGGWARDFSRIKEE